MKKKLTEKERVIGSAKWRDSVMFYCWRCHHEFGAIGKKWVSDDMERATYRAECPSCGKNLERWITDKRDDPYWNNPRLRRERAVYWKETLQPGQEGFRTVYGKTENEVKLERKQYNDEKKAWEKKQDVGKSVISI